MTETSRIYTATLFPKGPLEDRTSVSELAKAVENSLPYFGENNGFGYAASDEDDFVSLNLPVSTTIRRDGRVEFQGYVEGRLDSENLEKLRASMVKTKRILQTAFPGLKYNHPVFETTDVLDSKEEEALRTFLVGLGLNPEDVVAKPYKDTTSYYV